MSAARRVGIGGIVLGALATWLALPPLAARTAALPVVVGLLAVAAGIWSWARDERRAGGGAVAAGMVGLGLGLLATRSSTTHLDEVFVWSTLGATTLRFATPLVYAAIGGLYCERSGVINVALEGMLLTGAFFGIWGAIWAHAWAGGAAWAVGLATAALAGMALAAIHAVWAIQFKVDQIISGTALNFLALGITGYLYVDKFGDAGTPGNVSDYGIPDVHLPIEHWYFVGPLLGQLNLMIWLSFVLLVVTYVVVFRTPAGLQLRSVGEHPRAADTVGISVFKVRALAVIASGGIAALGGAYISLGYVHSFNQGMTNGIGFIGLAALIFGKWRPFATWGATLLFGFSSALAQVQLPSAYGSEWGTLFQALPYLLTIVAVAGVIGRSVGPAAAGRPYDRQ